MPQEMNPTDSAFEDNPEIEVPDPPSHPSMLTVRVDIVDAQPPIWRRLELRGDLNLPAIHDHLQAGFGWLNSHLHRFDAPGSSTRVGPYFLTDFDIVEGDTGTPEADVRLDQVLREPGDRLRYTYDFGDDWEHRLVVESTRPAGADDPAARCTSGRGACPPEDVGGIHTWNELAAALRADPDPTHLSGNLAMYADWLPPDCAPDEFSVDTTNVMLSVVGADGAETMRALEALAPGDVVHLPEPRPELAAFLDKCTPDVVAQCAQIAARAVGLGETPTDDDLQTTLRPWQALLDTIGSDGVQLTTAGWLPPTAVRQICHDGGISVRHGQGNRENHTAEVAMLRREAVRAGLVRKSKGRLLLTKSGQRCRTSEADLVQAVAHTFIRDKDEFDQDSRVVTLLFIAADWQIGPDSRWAADAEARGADLRDFEIYQAFEDDVAHLLTERGWSIEGHLPLHRDDLGSGFHQVLSQLNLGRGRLFELPRSPAIRELARMALFE